MRSILAATFVVSFASGGLATIRWATPFAVVGPNDGVRCVITNLDKKAQFVDAEVLDSVGTQVTLSGSGRLCPTTSPLNVNFSCFNDGPTGRNGYCSFTSESSKVRAVLEITDAPTQSLHVVIPATKQ